MGSCGPGIARTTSRWSVLSVTVWKRRRLVLAIGVATAAMTLEWILR